LSIQIPHVQDRTGVVELVIDGDLRSTCGWVRSA